MQMQEHLGPLERVVRTKLLPALLGDSTPLSDVERELFALPCKYGGLAINNSVADARHRLADSRLLSLSLQKKLLAGEAELGFDQSEHRAVVSSIKAKWASRYESRRVKLYRENPGLKRIIKYASEKGASNILTTLPLEKYGFAIKAKKDFRDLLCLRYRRPVKRLPSSCVCGAKYSLDHSQICKRGGFIHMRHDDPKNCFLLAYIETHKANLTWSQSRESSSGTNQPSLLTMLALMLELEASGRECEMHFSSLGFFIPSHVVIPTLSLLPCTNCKQTHASGNTRNESETLKMGILLR